MSNCFKGAYSLFHFCLDTKVEQKVATNPQVINVARLPKGVYLLKLSDGTNSMTSKFVKE